MDHIFDGLHLSDMTDQATIFIAGLSPYVTFIIGILFAFFVINFIIGATKEAKTTANTRNDFDTGEDFDDEE